MPCCCTVRADAASVCQEDFSVFLAGIPLPIAALSVFVNYATPTDSGDLTPNPSPIHTEEELLEYLNATVIPQLVGAGHVVAGVFERWGQNRIRMPLVDGGCLSAHIRRVPII